MRDIVIGSRGSDLALWQANFIKDILLEKCGISSTIKVIVTTGDRITNMSFDKIEGIGFFTKEIEEAILCGEVDIAVHSLKDLTTTLPEGLILPMIGFRVDRREMLLAREEALILLDASTTKTSTAKTSTTKTLPLKDGAVIGTSSARRKSQIRHLNPTLELRDIRGNVPTRIERVKRGDYDAIIIAVAGVERLNSDLGGLKSLKLDAEAFLPAPGQGTLAIESRETDTELNAILSVLSDETTRIEIALERGLLKRFDAGCSLPLGVYCEVNSGGTHRFVSTLGVENEDGSPGLRRIEVNGSDVAALVSESYDALNGVRVG
jgi:hydroxymethylbilane synthase